MDVMQREVEMYENEIRALKDQKTPKRGGAAARGTPRRVTSSVAELTQQARGSSLQTDDMQGNTGVLEATLFRPALQQALREVNRWKAATMTSSIMDLPPLPTIMPPPLIRVAEDGKEEIDYTGPSTAFFSDDYYRLTSAINNCRIVKASVKMVDLTNREKAPRAQLKEMIAKSNAATQLVETTMMRCRGNML
jgi:hypothetical protein